MDTLFQVLPLVELLAILMMRLFLLCSVNILIMKKKLFLIEQKKGQNLKMKRSTWNPFAMARTILFCLGERKAEKQQQYITWSNI